MSDLAGIWRRIASPIKAKLRGLKSERFEGGYWLTEEDYAGVSWNLELENYTHAELYSKENESHCGRFFSLKIEGTELSPVLFDMHNSLLRLPPNKYFELVELNGELAKELEGSYFWHLSLDYTSELVGGFEEVEEDIVDKQCKGQTLEATVDRYYSPEYELKVQPWREEDSFQVFLAMKFVQEGYDNYFCEKGFVFLNYLVPCEDYFDCISLEEDEVSRLNEEIEMISSKPDKTAKVESYEKIRDS